MFAISTKPRPEVDFVLNPRVIQDQIVGAIDDLPPETFLSAFQRLRWPDGYSEAERAAINAMAAQAKANAKREMGLDHPNPPLLENLKAQPWRLFSPALAHISTQHFLMNMVSLGGVWNVQDVTTNGEMATLVLGSALGSEILSRKFDGPLGVGASGVISGLRSYKLVRMQRASTAMIAGLFVIDNVISCVAGWLGGYKVTAFGHLGGALFGYTMAKYHEFRAARPVKVLPDARLSEPGAQG